MFTDILNKNFNMIERQIMSSNNQLHLDTCRRMIEERIVIWGDWERENKLYNLIQVREVELIAQEYPLVEG